MEQELLPQREHITFPKHGTASTARGLAARGWASSFTFGTLRWGNPDESSVIIFKIGWGRQGGVQESREQGGRRDSPDKSTWPPQEVWKTLGLEKEYMLKGISSLWKLGPDPNDSKDVGTFTLQITKDLNSAKELNRWKDACSPEHLQRGRAWSRPGYNTKRSVWDSRATYPKKKHVRHFPGWTDAQPLQPQQAADKIL